MMEMGAAPIVRMGCRPDGLLVHLPVIFACTVKSRSWRAVMEEVDKGCSEFWVTVVGTAIRTAGILIHSCLKALAVNLSRPYGRLWLYAGFIGSNNHRWLKADCVVCPNPFSSSSWV